MAKLYVMQGRDKSQSVDLRDTPIFIGRSSDNDVQLRDKTVSRKHLKIFTKENRYYIEDLDSKNGTYVNGEQILPGREIEIDEGHPIVIGMCVLCVGEGCLEAVKDYLDSIDVAKTPQELSETDTIIIEVQEDN